VELLRGGREIKPEPFAPRKPVAAPAASTAAIRGARSPNSAAFAVAVRLAFSLSYSRIGTKTCLRRTRRHVRACSSPACRADAPWEPGRGSPITGFGEDAVSMPRLGPFLRLRSRPAVRATPRYRPHLEALEDRLVPSAGVRTPSQGEDESTAEAMTDPLHVVTYNLDAGSDLVPLAAASSPADLPAAVSRVWADVRASNIPERALTLAREIAQADPDVAAIQEAALWTVNGLPRFDFLGLLRQDLRARGRPFLVAAGEAVDVFRLTDAAGEQIGYQDRTVILVNAGMASRGFRVAAPTGGTFASHRTIQLGGPGGMTLSLPGTWASARIVNTQNPDHTFQMVTVHLDDADPTVSDAQARQLVAGPAQTPLPIVVAGDFGAQGPFLDSYAEMGVSFYDTWRVDHPGAAGLAATAADPSLRDPVRDLQEHRDMIWIKTLLEVKHTHPLGAGPSDRTPSGLLPSDHLGVEAGVILD
jgi:endonuclease/exonuclease/phosphatase family metal-dependent hydrolase